MLVWERFWQPASTSSWKMMEQGIYVSMGAFLAPVMSLVVREGAVAWSRSATGAVTMMTRYSIALRSHTSDFDAEYI